LRLLVSGPTSKFYGLILELIGGTTSFDRCFLILFEDESLETLKIAARRFDPRVPFRDSSEVYVSREILKRVRASRQAVALSSGEPSFVPSDSYVRSGARSLLCIPLVIGETVSGVLYIDRLLDSEPFSEEEARELAPLASLLALKAENEQLLDAQVETQVNRRELEIARTVQERFLPKRRVALGDYSFEAFTQPGHQVGGDCLDFIATGDRLIFAVGDVTGRGLAAAMYMVGVLSTLRAHAGGGLTLQAVMAKLSDYVQEKFRPDHFLTLFLGEIDSRTGTLAYCSAGHLPALVFSTDGTVRELDSRDPAFNIGAPEEFSCHAYAMAPGDIVLVYTDGLIETENEQADAFGKERLVECVLDLRHRSLDQIRDGILAALRGFCPQTASQDDTTFVLLKRNEDQEEPAA
jgi:serine phosphatase RsbU (regulator of sigma subunit)